MDAQAFLEQPEPRRIVGRAAKAAAIPLSLHAFNGGAEGPLLVGHGLSAAACSHVARLPWGKQACRRSREKAAEAAARRAKPVPFLCHMGFSCVAMPALLDEGDGGSLTFGPFCPTQSPDSLELDAREGLSALEGPRALGASPREELPFDLSDISQAPADAVPSVAEWAAETLTALWGARRQEESEEEVAPHGSHGDLPPSRRRRTAATARDPYQAADIAAALGGGNQGQVRGLVQGAIADTAAGKRLTPAVKRARAVAVVAAVLEAAERAGFKTTGSWERFGAFQQAAREANRDRELCTAAMKVLSVLRRESRETNTDKHPLAGLNRLILERITEGVTLREAAEALGQGPTAITHRLQRKFGMSFTEYVGRIRVDMAKDLLRRTRLRMSDITRRVGLTDAANFSKLFRRHEGMSPTEYRKQFGQDALKRRAKGKAARR